MYQVIHVIVVSDLTFVIFPPQMHLWAQVFSTWKRINCGKKLHKFCIYGDVFYITHMPYVENFRFLHICHVETSEISPHVEKFSISPQLSYMESWNISTWQFFSTNNISDISDKYEVWVAPLKKSYFPVDHVISSSGPSVACMFETKWADLSLSSNRPVWILFCPSHIPALYFL